MGSQKDQNSFAVQMKGNAKQVVSIASLFFVQ